MTTEVQTYIESGLQLLDEKEEALKAMAEQYTGLTVAGLEDKEGFDKLRKARITLKGERVAIKNAAEDRHLFAVISTELRSVAGTATIKIDEL